MARTTAPKNNIRRGDAEKNEIQQTKPEGAEMAEAAEALLMKRVAEPLDSARRQDHRYHIETYVLPLHAGTPGVVAGGADQMELLLGADGALGFPEFRTVAGLHLDEDQLFAVPDYQIDLAVAGRGAIIAGHYGATAAPQITMRQVFSQASVIVFEGTAPQGIGRAVYEVEHLLKDLELEFHYLAADDVAEVIFPEFPVAPEMVHEKFEPQPPPKRQ